MYHEADSQIPKRANAMVLIHWIFEPYIFEPYGMFDVKEHYSLSSSDRTYKSVHLTVK